MENKTDIEKEIVIGFCFYSGLAIIFILCLIFSFYILSNVAAGTLTVGYGALLISGFIAPIILRFFCRCFTIELSKSEFMYNKKDILYHNNNISSRYLFKTRAVKTAKVGICPDKVVEPSIAFDIGDEVFKKKSIYLGIVLSDIKPDFFLTKKVDDIKAYINDAIVFFVKENMVGLESIKNPYNKKEQQLLTDMFDSFNLEHNLFPGINASISFETEYS